MNQTLKVDKITNCISSLLYNHECVILPGFGGFLTHYLQSEIDQATHRFSPPSRKLRFNGSLQLNDGLLIQTYAEQEGLDYQEAKIAIEHFVDELKRKLEVDSKVSLKGIGFLTKKQQGLLIFDPSPINFLNDSFGLLSFSSPAISRKTVSRRTVKPRIDRKPVKKTAKTPASVKWTMALTVPLIIFLLWGIIWPQSATRIYEQSSSLVDLKFFNTPEKTVIIRESMNSLAFMMPFPFSPTLAEKNIDLQIKNLQNTVFFETPPEQSQLLQSYEKGMYYIIGGAFKTMVNAKKYTDKIAVQEIDAVVLEKNDKGYFRVSYGMYNSKSDALQALKSIREEFNPDAWLFRY